MSRLLIKGGRVVTAVDDYLADVLIEGDDDLRDLRRRHGAPASTPASIDATGKLVIPGGIDPHTHMDCRSAARSSSDDFETGTIAAAHGGTTTIIDFAVQYKGEPLREGARRVARRRPRARPSIDYGFHMIMHRPARRAPRRDGRAIVDEGVTSLQAVHGLPGRLPASTTARSSGACTRAGRERRAHLHARRERRRHRRAREAGARRRDTPRRSITRSRGRRAPRPRASHRAIALAEMAGRAGLHRAPQLPRRARAGRRARATAACPRTPRPARSTCSSTTTIYERARLRRREVRHDAAAARASGNQDELWRGLEAQRPAGRVAPTTARSA